MVSGRSKEKGEPIKKRLDSASRKSWEYPECPNCGLISPVDSISGENARFRGLPRWVCHRCREEFTKKDPTGLRN